MHFALASKKATFVLCQNIRIYRDTVSRISYHIVWFTKYRYKVMKGDFQLRCRELLLEICTAQDAEILKGVVSTNHVHMHIEYAPKQSISFLAK